MEDSNIVKDFDTNRFLSSLFQVSKAVILSPKPFFNGMKRDGGLITPFLFSVCCVVVHALLISLVLGDQGIISRNLLFGIIFPFITAGILFLVITRLFKETGTYETVFRVNAYASAVSLLSWIPVAGLILEFYRIYILAIGLSCTFSIKASRAFGAILLTLAVYIVAAGVLSHATGGQWP